MSREKLKETFYKEEREAANLYRRLLRRSVRAGLFAATVGEAFEELPDFVSGSNASAALALKSRWVSKSIAP